MHSMALDSYQLPFNDNEEIETFYNFHGAHVLRINTTNSNLFLEKGRIFDREVVKNLDEKGRCKIIYIGDKVPPLSALLKFIENPEFQVSWGVFAVILPKEKDLIDKFVHILVTGLSITGSLKNKYTLKFFRNEYRNKLNEVIEWMDRAMEKQEHKTTLV